MSIDVILITYNQEKYISQAVESILMQEVDATVRIIVADDASTDRTVEIIRPYIEKSPFEFVFLPQTDNLGISKNYLRAFKACTGDYIAILEGDDYWSSPHHLQLHASFLNEHRECSLTKNSTTPYLEDERRFEPAPWRYSDENIHFVGIAEQIGRGNQLGNLSACVLRTKCVQQLPDDLFDMYITDWMLGVMLLEYGVLTVFRESTSVYRVHGKGLWSGISEEEQRAQQLEMTKMYRDYQKGLHAEFWSQCMKRYEEPKQKYYVSDFVPPILFYLLKGCVPPALYKWVKKKI